MTLSFSSVSDNLIEDCIGNSKFGAKYFKVDNVSFPSTFSNIEASHYFLCDHERMTLVKLLNQYLNTLLKAFTVHQKFSLGTWAGSII